MRTVVQIKDGKAQTYYYRKTLYDMGFHFRRKDKTWIKKESDESLVDYYKVFSKSRNLTIRTFKESFERSNDYRKNFFLKNPPHLNGKYFCAYCGSLISPEEVTVDHIIPVVKAQRNSFSQWFLKKINITDINDERNLACCCLECNSRKGRKLGLWTIRGFVGKHKMFWYIFYAILIIFIIFLLITAYEVMNYGT